MKVHYKREELLKELHTLQERLHNKLDPEINKLEAFLNSKQQEINIAKQKFKELPADWYEGFVEHTFQEVEDGNSLFFTKFVKVPDTKFNYTKALTFLQSIDALLQITCITVPLSSRFVSYTPIETLKFKRYNGKLDRFYIAVPTLTYLPENSRVDLLIEYVVMIDDLVKQTKMVAETCDLIMLEQTELDTLNTLYKLLEK